MTSLNQQFKPVIFTFIILLSMIKTIPLLPQRKNAETMKLQIIDTATSTPTEAPCSGPFLKALGAVATERRDKWLRASHA